MIYTYKLYNDTGLTVRADIYQHGYFYMQGPRMGSSLAAKNWGEQKIEELNKGV